MTTLIQLLVALSILVFIHELGHFFFARLFGTRVEKFYLFFNPWFSLLKWKDKKTGTIYGLGWVPLGGYCQIAGMIDESMDTEQMKSKPKQDEFRSKSTWQRLLIMAGGIIFNLILAFLLYITIALVWGENKIDTTDVKAGWSFSSSMEKIGFRDGDIIYSIDGERGLNALDERLNERLINAKEVHVLRSGKEEKISIPANLMQQVLAEGKGISQINIPFIIDEIHNKELKQLGVQIGDQVTAINMKNTPSVPDVLEILSVSKGKSIELALLRGDSTILVKATVNKEGKLGIALRSPQDIYPIEKISYSLLEAIPAGFNKSINTITGYVAGLKHIFTKEGAQSLGGLGSMAKLFPTGFNWQAFWTTTAFLSVILAIMNLLPIPALDGGHIVFIIIEMITGKKPNDQLMSYIQMGGMIFLLLLMLYANGNDIYRFLIK